MKTVEILVIRSSISNRLYDVVKVDFFTEVVEFLDKGLEFEEAVGKAEFHKEEAVA